MILQPLEDAAFRDAHLVVMYRNMRSYISKRDFFDISILKNVTVGKEVGLYDGSFNKQYGRRE